jgi:DNA-directed RNA polymerase subunit beta'
MSTSLGHLLINSILPASHQLSGPVTNKALHDHVVGLAKSNPELYVKTITDLKRRGDEIATLEGVSVGLEDIRPDYMGRNAILEPAVAALSKARTKEEKERIILGAQAEILAHTKKHPGSMTHMALSGARGNPGQLMKIVDTPLATVHPKEGLVPRIFDKSYSEGLSPAQYWLAGPEVRANEVAARISVSEPGEVAKVLVANMISNVVVEPDCGTHAGIRMPIEEDHILDRYTQENPGVPRNTLVTPRLLQELKVRRIATLLVRSPMTCGSTHGVCQHCQGLNEKGQSHIIGSTVGVRAAQAMAEPLTQMALSSRHGTLTVKGSSKAAVGLKGVRQFLEIPKAFRFEAAISGHDGVVTRIEKAPQGGHYIYVGTEKNYAAPELEVLVSVGSHVEAGDALTDGVPHPAKVVEHKGLGAGRAYFVNALHRVYKNEGVNLDKRHLELLAKSEINHVRLMDVDPEHPELLKGDIINYNAFRNTYGKTAVEVPLSQAVGRRLGKEIRHHTVGTLVTPNLVKELKESGVIAVEVAPTMPRVEFVMKPFTMNPLLDPDWMARLAHRYLKTSIADAVHTGDVSDIHTTHPVPAYAFGAEMRNGPGGTF